MSTLEELKKLQQKQKERLQEEFSKTNEREDDDKFWNLVRGPDGNAAATIRFLPAPKGEDLPYIHFYTHSFKNEKTGKWYIEKSLTTFKEKDPVAELNSKLWNQGGDEGKEQARKQKRTENYVANVLIIKDNQNPENNGKVVLFRFGKKIFEKIKKASMPDDDLGYEGGDPFDLFNGMNFALRIKTVSGFANYDDSTFGSPSRAAKTDDELVEIWNKCVPLQPILNKNVKSYDELKARLQEVLGDDEEISPKTSKHQSKHVDEDDDITSKLSDVDLEDKSIDELLKDL